MSGNLVLERSDHAADLRKVLAGFRITDAERQSLAELRVQLVELGGQLSTVSNPAVSREVRSARCGIRSGTLGPDALQSALRRSEDKRDIRRALKSRNAELGREAGRLLEGVFTRAADAARPLVAKIRAEAEARIRTFLPTADASKLAAQDPVVRGLTDGLELLETHAASCADAQLEDGRWRLSAETLDRLLASLGLNLSDRQELAA